MAGKQLDSHVFGHLLGEDKWNFLTRQRLHESWQFGHLDSSQWLDFRLDIWHFFALVDFWIDVETILVERQIKFAIVLNSHTKSSQAANLSLNV